MIHTFTCVCGKVVKSNNKFSLSKKWCWGCKYSRKLEKARERKRCTLI